MKKNLKTSVAGCVATIIVNVIMLYVSNNLLNWHVPFLTDSFTACLGILNISIIATIIANIFFLIYNEDWFLHLCKFGLNIIGLVFIISLVTIFPFSFNGTMPQIVKILLILGAIGTAIAVIVELTQSVKGIIIKCNA